MQLLKLTGRHGNIKENILMMNYWSLKKLVLEELYTYPANATAAKIDKVTIEINAVIR